MKKYRKKPIVVDAEQFFPDVKPWPDGVYEETGPIGTWDHGFRILTLEGEVRVSPKDWILTGVQGEKYPCKPDIFEATYDLVEE